MTNYKLFSGNFFNKTRAREWLVDTKKRIENLPNFQKTEYFLKGKIMYVQGFDKKIVSKKSSSGGRSLFWESQIMCLLNRVGYFLKVYSDI